MKSIYCATRTYWLPSRVRADQGTENVDVAKYMFNRPLRGPGRRSFIAGKSCHNQRIERLWRDVFCSCLYKFYHVFWYLEDSEIFNINNELSHGGKTVKDVANFRILDKTAGAAFLIMV